MLGQRACPGPQLTRGRGLRGLSLVLQMPLPPGSHRCPVNCRKPRQSSASPEAAQDALVDRVEDRELTRADDLRVFHLHDARRAASQARSASFSVSAIACS